MPYRLFAPLAALLLIVAACGGTSEPSSSTAPATAPVLSYPNDGATISSSGDFSWLADGKGGNYLLATVPGEDGAISGEIYHATGTTITKIASGGAPQVAGIFGGDLVVADGAVDMFGYAGAAKLSAEDAAIGFSRIDTTGAAISLTVSDKVRSAILWLSSFYSSDVRGVAFADGVAFATMDDFPALPMGSYYLDASLTLTPLVGAVGDQSLFVSDGSLYASGYNAANTGGNEAFVASKVEGVAACSAANMVMGFVARFAAGSTIPAEASCLEGADGRVVQFGARSIATDSEVAVAIGKNVFFVGTTVTSIENADLPFATLPIRPTYVGRDTMAFVRSCLDREGADSTCTDSEVAFDVGTGSNSTVTLLAYQVWAVAPMKDGNAYVSVANADSVSIYYADATARPSVAIRVGGIDMAGNTTGSFELHELSDKTFLCTNGSVYRVLAGYATLLGEGDCYAAADALWIATTDEAGTQTTFRAIDPMR